MPPKYVPATKCDAYVPHCARTVFLACCSGNVPRTIVIWDNSVKNEAEKAAENNSMAGRVKRQLARKKLGDEYTDEEGSIPTYGAGLH